MKLRILRQPTDIQADGKWYIDILQYKTVHTHHSKTTAGISGMDIVKTTESEWMDVEVLEADKYLEDKK